MRLTVLIILAILLSATIPASAAVAELPTVIRVNQLGYNLTDAKIAVAMADVPITAPFAVVDASTRQPAFKGTSHALAGRWGQFTHLVELDFSALRKPGRYVVQLGAAQSAPFNIAADVYAALPDQLLEFMRQQRCGYNPWLDVVCHPFDGRTAFGPLPAGTYLDATGGWHDAGDMLKYLITTSNATAQMLLAYRLQRKPARFDDRFNERGQPGANGIPDILDEARWGLDWLLKLHPASDQLYHQVADDRDHIGWRLPQNETANYGWGPGSYRVVYFADGKPQGLAKYKSESNGIANIAGRYAAAMALGYQIWREDARFGAYARRLLRAGIEVYAMGRAREGVQQGNSYLAPYRYEETTWADDMEWGAAELWRATGDRRYLADARRYADLAAAESWMGSEQTKHYQYYPFMNVGHFRLYDQTDGAQRKRLANYYREGITRCIRAAAKNAYQIGVPFIWCSNNLVVALATQCLMYERMTGDRSVRVFRTKQRDWLLGRNPWGVSMFTEIPAGGVYPKDVHLVTTSLLKRPVRGALVDGPVYRRIFQSLRGVSITEPDPFQPFQDDLAVYHDDIKDYSTNEPTMDGTASAVLLWTLEE
ncbi:MAG TPA: glycoside hydrolase family 9 protein [Blastocatellia bacterium]|nr:glycoside hydrolase family 9 protein [Blastocatellia bacterium]